MVTTTVGIAFSGKIREKINKKGWFANKNQLQAIVEQDNSGTEIAEQSDQENNDMAVQDSSVSTQAVDTSNWDLTKVDIVYDTANVAVPVPKGYVASGADGEHTVNTGFVIYEGDTAVTTANALDESCKRNQWVWVPVPDVSRIYEIDANGKKKSKLYEYSSTGRTEYTNDNYEPGVAFGHSKWNPEISFDTENFFSEYQLQGMTREKFLHEMQEEFDFTIESIKKYGGFYIGRYEIGNLSEKVLVVQRLNTDINTEYQSWYSEYSKLQRLGANGNVKSNMILGCLWDETLQWLIDSGNKTNEDMIDSTSWGNYSNSSFDYIYSIKNGNAEKIYKPENRSQIMATGGTEYSKANNIYDLAGNVWEMTLEVYVSGARVIRSGVYWRGGAYKTMSCRYWDGYEKTPDSGSEYIGARAYLYIK